MKVASVSLSAVLFFCTLVSAESAGNWPRWRGPADQGSTATGSYPIKLDGSTNLLWKIALPGNGCSTPIVWDHRIYVTAPAEGNDTLLAFDWEGKSLWQTTVGADRQGKSHNGSGCNPSPTTDGKNLFVYFKSGTLAGLSLDGKILWKTNLQQRFGKDTLFWDIGTSPVLTEKDVVIAVMHHGGSYLAAFDKETGEMHWRVSRDYQTPTECDHSYATPILFLQEGKELLLVWGGEHLTAHDTSDGKEIWSVAGFNPQRRNNWVVVASPVIVGDMAVVPFGRGTELHGIKLGGVGDLTSKNRIWERSDTGSFVPTPAEYKGRVYILKDRGELECVDPATGKTTWSGRLPRKSASYYSSPTVADGKLYAAREDGMVFVAKVDGDFALLSENDLGERVIASPVPVDNHLLIRGEKHLFCFGAK